MRKGTQELARFNFRSWPNANSSPQCQLLGTSLFQQCLGYKGRQRYNRWHNYELYWCGWDWKWDVWYLGTSKKLSQQGWRFVFGVSCIALDRFVNIVSLRTFLESVVEETFQDKTAFLSTSGSLKSPVIIYSNVIKMALLISPGPHYRK